MHYTVSVELDIILPSNSLLGLPNVWNASRDGP